MDAPGEAPETLPPNQDGEAHYPNRQERDQDSEEPARIIGVRFAK